MSPPPSSTVRGRRLEGTGDVPQPAVAPWRKARVRAESCAVSEFPSLPAHLAAVQLFCDLALSGVDISPHTVLPETERPLQRVSFQNVSAEYL